MKKSFGVLFGLWLGLVAQSAHADVAVALAGGAKHSCAVTENGGVQCWGSNDDGQLGNNSVISSKVPVAVSNLGSGVVEVASGASHSCALLANGTVQCWGRNGTGQLGNGTLASSKIPVAVTGVSGITHISAGGYHSCALSGSGTVQCWGWNNRGQIGDASTTDRASAVAVLGVSGITAIAAGYTHTCALVNSGAVKCWGDNGYGQLGNGTANSSSTRVDVVGLADANAIAAGWAHTCVSTSGGKAKCWGRNLEGQLGNGSTQLFVNVPGVVLNLADIVQLATSSTEHTNCAVVSGGVAKCWGNNFYGNLGTGDTTNRSAPANVVGLAGAASSVTPGGYHTCARVSAGVQCWGLNANGQLGAGNTTTTVFPQNTLGLFGVAPPATGTVSPVTSNYPVYTWKAVSGTAGYRLRVNGVITTYTPDQANCPLGTGLCTVTGPYLAPGAYSWQVQPYNSYGDAPWSALTQFSI